MIINVRFEYEDTGRFSNKTYSYLTDLVVDKGDIVLAPTPDGNKRAIVAETNVSEDEINEHVFANLKTITAVHL